MKKWRNVSGFTLVELLIAISILAIWAVIGLISFRQVLQNSRDSKRLSDIRQIQSALEEYRADQHVYPQKGTICDNGTFKVGCPLTDSTGNKKYINPVPSDPTGPDYLYELSGSSYCLYAHMENTQNTSSQNSCQQYFDNYNFEATTP